MKTLWNSEVVSPILIKIMISNSVSECNTIYNSRRIAFMCKTAGK
jgi:hypothetical protein